MSCLLGFKLLYEGGAVLTRPWLNQSRGKVPDNRLHAAGVQVQRRGFGVLKIHRFIRCTIGGVWPPQRHSFPSKSNLRSVMLKSQAKLLTIDFWASFCLGSTPASIRNRVGWRQIDQSGSVKTPFSVHKSPQTPCRSLSWREAAERSIPEPNDSWQ